MLINKSFRLFCFSILYFLSNSLAAGQPLSNEQVVITAVREAVDSALEEDTNEVIGIVCEEGGLSGLFATGIAEGIMNKFSRVMITPLADSSSENLFFDIFGFDFDYKKGRSRGYLRANKIRRELGCELSITIKSGADGTLRDIKRLRVAYSDQIEPSEVRVVNSRKIPELAPESPGSGWSRYAEPSLVIGTVGVLVYLFFANR